MKVIFFFSLLILTSNQVLAQNAFFSLGSGTSNFTSNYESRYSNSISINANIGYDRSFSKLGYRIAFGLYNINAKIIDLDKYLKVNILRLSSGLTYKISPSWSLLSQINIGKTTKKSIRISSPRYNYDFDPIDFSLSFEIGKKFSINNCNCYAISVEYSKSIDGIIDNNFWQKDNLKPYYINANIYYYFKD